MIQIIISKLFQWPPYSVFSKHFNIDHIVKTCYDRCGVDKNEVIEFEMSEDLEHLPNSQALKCYIRCSGELFETLDTKSNKILISKYADVFPDFSHEEQEITVRMASGCLKKVKKVTDRLDFAYELTVCIKRNDNKVI